MEKDGRTCVKIIIKEAIICDRRHTFLSIGLVLGCPIWLKYSSPVYSKLTYESSDPWIFSYSSAENIGSKFFSGDPWRLWRGNSRYFRYDKITFASSKPLNRKWSNCERLVLFVRWSYLRLGQQGNWKSLWMPNQPKWLQAGKENNYKLGVINPTVPAVPIFPWKISFWKVGTCTNSDDHWPGLWAGQVD